MQFWTHFGSFTTALFIEHSFDIDCFHDSYCYTVCEILSERGIVFSF